MSVNNTIIPNKDISTLITSSAKVKFRPKTYEEVKNFSGSSPQFLMNASIEIDYFKYLENLIKSHSDSNITSIMEAYLNKYDYRKRYSSEVIKKIDEYDITSEIIKDTKHFEYTTWKIQSLTWNNILIYGEGNKLVFSDVVEIIGIIGQNSLGKTSILEIIYFAVFGELTKRTEEVDGKSSISDIGNFNSKDFVSVITIRQNNDIIVIEKNGKLSKKKQSTSAPITSNYYKVKTFIYVNGSKLNNVSKEADVKNYIKLHFGDSEQFRRLF